MSAVCQDMNNVFPICDIRTGSNWAFACEGQSQGQELLSPD